MPRVEYLVVREEPVSMVKVPGREQKIMFDAREDGRKFAFVHDDEILKWMRLSGSFRVYEDGEDIDAKDETDQPFINEWIRMPLPKFPRYVMENVGKFNRAADRTLSMAKKKWDKAIAENNYDYNWPCQEVENES